VQSAGKDPIEGEAVLDLLDGVRELYVAKGRNVLRFDMTKERPSDEELLDLMLGRSGKLRAPTLRAGEKLVVGYTAELLGETLR
jgi:arsenate reductase-like glutaredoxin family protein